MHFPKMWSIPNGKSASDSYIFNFSRCKNGMDLLCHHAEFGGAGTLHNARGWKVLYFCCFFRISFLPHVYLAPPLGVTPLDFTKTFDIRKLKSQDYCVACLLHLAISIAAGLYTGTQTDRQTDTGHDIHCANIVSHCEHSVIDDSTAGTTVVLKLVVVYLYVASEGPTDKRSILFVGSKDAVSMIQFCCNLIDFIWLCQHLHFISCSEYSESVRSWELMHVCLFVS